MPIGSACERPGASKLETRDTSSFIRRYGVRLLPDLYAHLNPTPYAAAAQMEIDLAEDLHSEGYTVLGGH